MTNELTLGVLEVSEDGRTEVPLLVLVGVVVDGESLPGDEVDVAHVLPVGGVLALAADPDHLADGLVALGLEVLDVVDELLGRRVVGAGGRKVGRVLVRLRLPVIDLEGKKLSPFDNLSSAID